jgi:uncharacterized protein
MILLTITSASAAIVTFLYVLLGLRVITLRRSGAGPSVGISGNEHFLRAVRAHANLGEYAPLFLILLGLNELQGGATWLLISIAAVFIIGRILHAIGFGFLGTGPWRTLGMVATNTALITLAALLLLHMT